MKTGDVIKKIRAMANLSQSELAQAVGCTQASISKFESGVKLPSLRLAKAIMKIGKMHKMKISLWDMFPDEIE